MLSHIHELMMGLLSSSWLVLFLFCSSVFYLAGRSEFKETVTQLVTLPVISVCPHDFI